MPQELQQAEAARRAKEAAHEAAEEERLLASCTVVDYKYMCVFMLGYAYVRSYTYIYIYTYPHIHTYIHTYKSIYAHNLTMYSLQHHILLQYDLFVWLGSVAVVP